MIINRNYKEEIISIIQENGGKLIGFNKLKELGHFHSSCLSNHLNELYTQNRIMIEPSESGRKHTTYSIMKSHYGSKIKINDNQINKIEKILENNLPESQKVYLVGCILRICIPKIRNIPLGELLVDLVDNYPSPKDELRDAKKHYMTIMKRNLRRLHEPDRRNLLNLLFEIEQPRQILEQAKNFLNLPSSA